MYLFRDNVLELLYNMIHNNNDTLAIRYGFTTHPLQPLRTHCGRTIIMLSNGHHRNGVLVGECRGSDAGSTEPPHQLIWRTSGIGGSPCFISKSGESTNHMVGVLLEALSRQQRLKRQPSAVLPCHCTAVLPCSSSLMTSHHYTEWLNWAELDCRYAEHSEHVQSRPRLNH